MEEARLCGPGSTAAQRQDGFVAGKEHRIAATARDKFHLGIRLPLIGLKAQWKICVGHGQVSRTRDSWLNTGLNCSNLGIRIARLSDWSARTAKNETQQQQRGDYTPRKDNSTTRVFRTLKSHWKGPLSCWVGTLWNK